MSWDDWYALGEVVIYESTSPDELLQRAAGAEVLLTNKVIISRQTIEALPQLRYVGVLATGYNVVDLAAASERGVVVTNIPAYSTMSVAQMVMAHLLNVTNHVADYAQEVRAGQWQSSRHFCFISHQQLELDGLLFGIVGMGNIGRAVARMVQSMGMRVMAFSSRSADELAALGVEKAESLESLFRQADVLSLHCPLTDDTHHIINKESLAWMKPTAILINTGRGPLIDEEALAEALNEERLLAACVDVLTQEPPTQGSPLIGARHCFITPHIAWASLAARHRLLQIAKKNIEAFLSGTPQNKVN